MPMMRKSKPTIMRLMKVSRKVRLIFVTTEETTSNNGESAMQNYSTEYTGCPKKKGD